MKALVLAASLALAASGPLHAGSAVYIPPAATGVEAPMANGSVNWLVPLAIIAVVVLIASSGDDCQKKSAEGLLSAAAPCGR